MAFQNVANLYKENVVASATLPPKISATNHAVASVSSRASPRRSRPRKDQSQHAAIQAAARKDRLAPKHESRSVDVEMTDAPAAVDPARIHLRLPERLARPAFKEIDSDSLAAIDSELAAMPIDYIKEKLLAAGPSMLTCVEKAKPVPVQGLPSELDVVINDLSAEVPTHILAVWSKERHPNGPRPVELFPVHNIILAASCALLPALPASRPTQPTTEGETMQLPLVPLCVPSRATFGLLQHYLYTGRDDRLFSHLIPMLVPGTRPQDIPRYLAQTYTPAVLTGHLVRIHGLWSNVCGLGIFDDGVWRVIDLAWATMKAALKLAEPSGVRVEALSRN